jgi:hypothetical protein
MGEIRNIRHKWEEILQMKLKNMNWILPAKIGQWSPFVNMVMNLRISQQSE